MNNTRPFEMSQEKFTESAIKLRESYKKIKDNQRRTILIEKKYNHLFAEQTVQKTSDICKAYNMNGNKCNRKVKENGLCGRHSKK
jgi:hypothetical protein